MSLKKDTGAETRDSSVSRFLNMFLLVDIDKLKVLRRILKGKVTHLEGKLKDNAPNLHLFLPHINELEVELNDLHNQIMLALSAEEEQDAAEKFFDLYDRIDHLRAGLSSSAAPEPLKESSTAAENNHSESETNENKPAEMPITLPKIELAAFSGEFENWLSFKDLFDSTVNANSLLSNVQKMQYLKLCQKQCHVSGPIDVLLGADVFHRILLSGWLIAFAFLWREAHI